MPYTTIPPKTTRSAPAISQPRFDRRTPLTTLSAGDLCGDALICVCDCIGIPILFSFKSFLLLLFSRVSCLSHPVDDAEDRRDEEQRRYGGEQQSSNYGATERCILLAA